MKKEKRCRICNGETKTSFLARYKEKGIDTKVFISECKSCTYNFIFFIKKDRFGNKKFLRTFT